MTYTPTLYVDFAQLLAGGIPEAPKPTIGIRTDDHALFYPSAVNVIFGPPESGKTLAASCVAADTLFAGGNVLLVDIDHNGAPATAARFRALGVPAEVLADPARFRFAEPDDAEQLGYVIAEANTWQPTLAIVDSIGELMPMHGGNSNDADDFTRVNKITLAALATTGAAVIAIDHEAKNQQSRTFGATGTAAKKRAIDGAYLRANVLTPFTPGHGGKASLNITKDRHGNLRATSPTGDTEPLAAVFELAQQGEALTWHFWAPRPTDHNPPAPDEQDTLENLIPAPTSIRDIKARLGWGSDKATRAFRTYRNTHPQNPSNVPVPRSSPTGRGTQEHAQNDEPGTFPEQQEHEEHPTETSTP